MTIGVLVMGYGTPSSAEAIEPYYTRIRHGNAPTPEQLADLTRRYEAIGGLSPLNERTAAQVDALRAELERRAPGAFSVRYGSKYEPPMLEEACAAFLADGVRDVIGLVLAPHSASMSTGQYFARARAALGDEAQLRGVEAWWDNERFIELVAGRVTAALDAFAPEERGDVKVVFSAHSLPERIVANGDTYPEQIAESAARVVRHAGISNVMTAWQSAGRTPEPWLGPDILLVLTELASQGVTSVVSCPIGFVSDHLEVLYDIDIEAQHVAQTNGIRLVRTASLNDDPAFISCLADVVMSQR